MSFTKPRKGLEASRWASNVTSWPRPPPTTFNSSRQPDPSLSRRAIPQPSHNDQPSSPEQQLSRFLKIISRLKWKIPFLEAGYAIALDRVGKSQQDIEANEIHFKLDFHEFYMLIERAIVHLMGVYDIVIYAQSDPNGYGYGVGSASQGQNDVFRDRSQPHRYHENVLMALDNPTNPLHQTLGQPGVRQQLARAKELRNRWKHADEADPGRFPPAPLEAYNLEEILQTVLLALDQAYFVTELYVRQRHPGSDQNQPVSIADWKTDADDWEFMVDAMDWEVV
ncbi:hypothetical protein NPX13_g6137 [Xylaria arbuscula]|uniref:Uncharacterized protein n=1 Tax=Xylaria arbuscula TaxID=114810 RepID=A0A9W8TKN2_9PEZI|nr:hypothetical protein NPX13_g6137 [Xylaria arbuscula]